MKRGRDMMNMKEADDYSDNFVVVTDLVSPLKRQLLEHVILLANTPADTQDPADTARDFRKLRLLESLVDAEKAQNPHYAVTRLVDLEEEAVADEGTEAEEEDTGPDQPPSLASRLMRLCGLDTLVEELRGDLSEERCNMVAEFGEPMARRWFHRQILMSVLPLLPKITRSLFISLLVSVATPFSKEAGAAVVAWAEELFRRLGH